MKVTMLKTLAGPEGIASPGFVVDLPKEEAEDYIAKAYARPYDPKRDKHPRRNRHGLVKAGQEV